MYIILINQAHWRRGAELGDEDAENSWLADGETTYYERNNH